VTPYVWSPELKEKDARAEVESQFRLGGINVGVRFGF
jgi:hypothetical protein